jgi:hypothetical protein
MTWFEYLARKRETTKVNIPIKINSNYNMKISARNTKVVLEVLYQNKNCKRRQPY